MKTAAVICEYNPFHYGHKYHLDRTREAGATHIVAVMSGNFTQRGDVAVFDKYARAKTALQNGADLVLELPARYSLMPAEAFARGAAEIITALNCIDMLSFGSESGSIDALKEAASAVEYVSHTEEFFRSLKDGKSYPAALQDALREYYTPDVSEVIMSPNNTLAIEYIAALDNLGSRIELFTAGRIGAGHDSASEKDSFASASFIRKKILAGEDYFDFAPAENEPSADIMRLERAILAKLRTFSEEDFDRIFDCANGLGDRLRKAVRRAGSLNELYFLTKTKRYTLARIRRAVLSGFLGLDKDFAREPAAYIRILGMNKRGREILAAAKCSLPVDTSLKALSGASAAAFRQANFEARCGDIYSLAFENPLPCGREFTAKPVILDD